MVDSDGRPVEEGDVGELIIGGVGLARYLDPPKDAEKYAAVPPLGWAAPTAAATSSGSRRRGWSSSAVPTTRSSSAAGGSSWARWTRRCWGCPVWPARPRRCARTAAGTRCWSATSPPPQEPARPGGRPGACAHAACRAGAAARRRRRRPHPDLGQGRPRRSPWPLERVGDAGRRRRRLPGTAGWLAQLWTARARVAVTGPTDDFFDDGGGSLSAAQLVSPAARALPGRHRRRRLREPAPGDLAEGLDEFARPWRRSAGTSRPTPRRARLVQGCSVAARLAARLRWLVWLARWATCGGERAGVLGCDGVLVVGAGRLAAAHHPARQDGDDGPGRPAAAAGPAPGTLPPRWQRASAAVVHRGARAAAGADNLPGAPWSPYYAAALGAAVGRDVDLHSMPPVTGLLVLGKGRAIEPEVDLSGHWLDGECCTSDASGWTRAPR